MTPIATNYTPLNYEFSVKSKHIWIVSATLTTEAPWHHLRCKVRLPSQVMSRGLSGYSGRYNSYMLQFYIKFVVQRCIVCCDRRHLDKSTSDYIRNTGTRGGRIFVTLVTSMPQQMYVILLIYQYIHKRLHSQYRYPWWTYFRVFGDFNAPTDVCNPANLPHTSVGALKSPKSRKYVHHGYLYCECNRSWIYLGDAYRNKLYTVELRI